MDTKNLQNCYTFVYELQGESVKLCNQIKDNIIKKIYQYPGTEEEKLFIYQKVFLHNPLTVDQDMYHVYKFLVSRGKVHYDSLHDAILNSPPVVSISMGGLYEIIPGVKFDTKTPIEV